MQEQSIFIEALDKADPAERAAFLEQACAGDEALRQRLERLLHRHREDSGFLEEPAAAALLATIAERVEERPGALIGPYKLLEQIGEGGFGVVFMAEQQEPMRRKVALKVLKPGMDTQQVVARFEAERQALALMDHPNIAKVHDGGATPSGRPYFVMELVKGLPITEYCDQAQLPPRPRLELFVSVCQAVQHAHQKGIIHRDLKPSNVLVTVHDVTPVVKVIDFGVAKALGQELTDKTLFTAFAQMIGTPLYMSPEQAGQSGLDIDTRSDIYSLGVLLYELLTGTTPFTKDRFKEATYEEIRRIIREEEPPKPSTRISTLGQAATTASTPRQSDPRRLSQLFRGELDWIVMKALEKDRNRRYETASAFAADVQRYLADEPVLACPPSVSYRVRKFARRHKAALLAAVLSGLVVLAAVGGIGWVAWDRASRQARTAYQIAQFLDRADSLYRDRRLPEALAEAELAEGLLEASAGNAPMQEQVRQRLKDLAMASRLEELQLAWFEPAEYARAFREYGIDIQTLTPEQAAAQIAASPIQGNLVPALDDWALRLPDSGPSRPVLQRRLRAIAQAADSDPWRRRCRQAADANDLRTLRAMAASADLTRTHASALAALGAALQTAGDGKAAIAFLHRVQQQYPGHVSVNITLVDCLHNLRPIPADEMIGLARVLVALRPKSPSAHVQLAMALTYTGRLDDEVIAAFRQAILLKPTYGNAHMLLATFLLKRKHDTAGAMVEFSRAIDAEPMMARFWYLRGDAYFNLGQRDKAMADYDQAIAVQPDYAESWLRRASGYSRLGRSEKALADLTQALKLNPSLDRAWCGRGLACWRLGQKDKALADLSKAIELKPDYTGAHNLRGDLLMELGQPAIALADLSYMVQATPPKYGEAHYKRARAYRLLGQWKNAVADLSVVIQRQPSWKNARMDRGWIYAEADQWKEAAADLAKLVDLEPEQPGYWYNLAMAHLGAGDKAAYAKLCTTMREHFRKASDPVTVEHVVSTCVVAPEGSTEPGEVLAIAQRAGSDKRVRSTGLLAAAFYRAGQADRALEYFEQKPHLTPRAWDWLFRAMAHQRLGQAKEARACLAKAQQWMTAAGKTPAGQTNTTRVRWFNWQEEAAVRELRTEAERMITGQEKAPGK